MSSEEVRQIRDDERARCVRVLRELARMARHRAEATGYDVRDVSAAGAFELAARCLLEDRA